MDILGLLRYHGRRGGGLETPLNVAAKGALADFAGTLMPTVGLKAAQLVARHGHKQDDEDQEGIGAGQALAGAEVHVPFLDQSTEIFVQKVAMGLFGVSLSSGQRRAAGVRTHFVRGSFWGALCGLLQSALQLPPSLRGPVVCPQPKYLYGRLDAARKPTGARTE